MVMTIFCVVLSELILLAEGFFFCTLWVTNTDVGYVLSAFKFVLNLTKIYFLNPLNMPTFFSINIYTFKLCVNGQTQVQ